MDDQLPQVPTFVPRAGGVIAARHLLESSDQPVEVVAQRAGLGSAGNLWQHLRREIGAAPSTYRHTFQTEWLGFFR